MNHERRRRASCPRASRWIGAACLLIFGLLPARLQAQVRVDLPVDHGTFGGASSEGSRVNATGAIIGDASYPVQGRGVRAARAASHGFYQASGGTLIDIDGDPGVHTSPQGVNAQGVVVTSHFGSNAQRYAASYWTAEKGLTSISLAGFTRLTAADVNDRGIALLNGRTADATQPVLFDIASGSATTLPCPPDVQCSAKALNTEGVVVGDLSEQPVFWEATSHTLRRLTLAPPLVRAYAQDVNDHGTILGMASDAEGHTFVVVWEAMHPDAPRVIGEGAAYGINNRGIIAGMLPVDREEPGADRHPRVWRARDGLTSALPGFQGEPALGTAADVNDDGVVVGTLWNPHRAATWRVSFSE